VNARPPVAVVVAVLNHGTTLRALFAALDATEWPGLRLVAVDCGSSDDSLALLRARAAQPTGPPLHLIEAPGLGRASALARGMATVPDHDVVRLHADVVPDHADWLERLWSVLAQHPDCGIVGGKIVLASGRIQSCGRHLIGGLGIVPEWSDLRWMEADRDEGPGAKEVDGVAGELCWIRRRVLTVTGGPDPNYDPVFGDDDDLCLLARWHGHRVLVEPAVRGVHHSSRHTQQTAPFPDANAALQQRLHDDRQALLGAHRAYFQRKWGFDPHAPDLHEIRRRYGHTRICWRIGAGLTETLPERPAVDVCFVTWNSMAVLPRMLQQLAATDWPELRVYVTDNGSTDGTPDWLEQQAKSLPFPLHVERFRLNMGVAQALNAAFVRGNAPLVARLDDDAFVPPDWLQVLVPNFHRRPYAGVVGPRIVHDNAGFALQCGPSRTAPHPLPGMDHGDPERANGLVRVAAICGCCNVYRRSVFARVGWLDVRFSPSQFDESDHHVAMGVAGYEALYDGRVTVRHQRNAGRTETPAAVGNFQGNRIKALAKWHGRQLVALDRGIDLSIDGRILPPDGDTRPLYERLPPVPAGPPRPVPREPEELARWTALARKRSLLRATNSPLAASHADLVLALEHAIATASPLVQGLVARVRDLVPDQPRALLALATQRWREGEPGLAQQFARWAARLSPDDHALQQAARQFVAPASTAAVAARPAEPAAVRHERVVLLPPLERGAADGELARAITATRDALAAVGVSCRIETRYAPTLEHAEVLHAFGLGDAATLVGRLQFCRATAPQCRLVLSSLLPDPAIARWYHQVQLAQPPGCARSLQRLFAAAAAGQLRINDGTERRLDLPPDDELDYARACFRFVDTWLVHTAAEAACWQRRLPELPTPHLLVEGAPGPLPVAPLDLAAASDLPYGGVLAVGPDELAANHLPMQLALADSPLSWTLLGSPAYPFHDGAWRERLGPRQRRLPPRHDAALAAAMRQSAVLLWLPAAAASLALPLQAAMAGCELVLASGLGAEALFGPHATYVDPWDLAGIAAACAAATLRWRDQQDAPWRTELRAQGSLRSYGQRLLAVYGLRPGSAGSPLTSPPHDREQQVADRQCVLA
jgi:GT2 family glycosyltransferase